MSTRAPGTFLGHPIGLFVLFFTEMWERFSYYGMRALLILYMTKQFLWVQEDASRVYKWYTSLVYFTPMLGGYLADRYLGNKRAVIIGAVLMAVGHFLMAFEDHSIFIAALIFLIMGNGFFKPNMATQVGRLYPKGDPRRDGAYTIFYMGINIGAFASPLVCGTLGEKVGYHWGFGAAGVGMVIGLVTYLLGYRWVIEVDKEAPSAGKTAGGKYCPTCGAEVSVGARGETLSCAACGTKSTVTPRRPEFDTAESAYPALASMAPWLSTGMAFVAFAFAIYFWITGTKPVDLDNGIFCALAGGALLVLSSVFFKVHGQSRDRTLAVGAVAIFVIAFWFAFEQAGNSLTVWAEGYTNRFVLNSGPSPQPSVNLPDAVKPPVPSATGIARYEVPASWFQSINPLGIALMAPLFAWFWLFLSRRGKEPSTPKKMAVGVFLAGMSFVAMVIAAMGEDRLSQATLAAMPDTIKLQGDALAFEDKSGHIEKFAAGRLKYSAGSKEVNMLYMYGVLTDLERNRILGESASPEFKKIIDELVEKSQVIGKQESVSQAQVRVIVDPLPVGFDLGWTSLENGVSFNAGDNSLVATRALQDRDQKLLLLAGADADLRTALFKIYRDSFAFRVSFMWLLLSYVLATMGELCLQPVGLSMVSKLAPIGYTTLLQGIWNCNNFFANFLAGFMGELWGKIPPVTFFAIFVVVTVVLSLVLYVFVGSIRKLMQGVH